MVANEFDFKLQLKQKESINEEKDCIIKGYSFLYEKILLLFLNKVRALLSTFDDLANNVGNL